MVPRRAYVVMVAAWAGACASCGNTTPALTTAEPGVVFTYPINGEVDVPTGARIVVTFSDPVVKTAVGACSGGSGAFCLVGPAGPIGATAEVSADGRSVQFSGADLAPGTKYDLFVRPEISGTATNLSASTPLVSFTTRTERPRAAAPSLVAVNGGSPTQIDSFRPMLETSTIRLLFSEPLDPRSVRLAPGAIELLDSTGSVVPALLVSDGIHVSVDPEDDLTAGAAYVLRLGNQLVDLGGTPMSPTAVNITPKQSRGASPIKQSLRTRGTGDPGPELSRSGATPNEIVLVKPLIGREVTTMLDAVLTAELHDPKAIGGPIAFTIRKGQRLSSTGLSIKLGGQIPVGLETGDVMIELLTDAGGRMYRNPYQPSEQRPENRNAPLFVDLSMDVAVYAKDPKGNAVLTQTVMGVQATGTAIATDGVLAIETVGSMELGLLGVTKAPANLVLELFTDKSNPTPAADTTPPAMVASSPAQSADHPVDAGIELIFDEPIDLERARNGGIRLEDTVTGPIATVIESHGAGVVVRPLAPLAYTRIYRVVMNDVADVAGNKLTAPNLSFTTPALQNTNVPGTVVAIHPGVPCSLTGASGTSAGHCAGGNNADDNYALFTMPADDPIEVAFSEPVRRTSVTRGAACNQGSIRIEEIDGAGTCTAVVAGTLITRDRRLSFIPDVPWVDGKRYRLTLVSGPDGGCGAGELCTANNAMSFDPLGGTESGDAGGPPLIINFTGAAPSGGTFMFADANPFTDVNGSGFIDSSEQERDENRAAMRIMTTTGSVNSASFQGADCIPGGAKEACMYLTGAMPVDMGEVTTTGCPGGATSCVPVTMSAQAMYATSVTMDANVGLTISTDTGTSVMRVREPAGGGKVMGYIVDKGGTPTMIASLDLYMDAPDMSILLSSHNLHSKPLSVALEGAVTFLADGRISIGLSNTADLPVSVAISGPLSGTVEMIVPMHEMRLQLVSPAPRGVSL